MAKLKVYKRPKIGSPNQKTIYMYKKYKKKNKSKGGTAKRIAKFGYGAAKKAMKLGAIAKAGAAMLK